MRYETAELVIRQLCEMSEAVHRPIEAGLSSDLTTEESRVVTMAVGDAVGIIYTDMMIPVLRRYPELDPDRGIDELSPGRAPSVSPPAGRRELGRRLTTAAGEQLVAFERLTQLIANDTSVSGHQPIQLSTDSVRLILADLKNIGNALEDPEAEVRYTRR
jgi:hypothetical protein